MKARVCLVCRSTLYLREIAVTVEGEKLRCSAVLCPRRGDMLIMRYGAAIGSLLSEREDSDSNLVKVLGLDERDKAGS